MVAGSRGAIYAIISSRIDMKVFAAFLLNFQKEFFNNFNNSTVLGD